MEMIFVLIGFLYYFAPIVLGSICLIIFFKRLGDKVIDLVPVRKSIALPVISKIVIRKRVIDLERKLATEVSIEATPEQVRSIFKKDYSP